MKAYVYFILLACFSSCAIISSPEGGEKDVTPPQVVEATPANKSTNFTASQIVLTFDEYINLKNFSGQFFASPPLKKPVETRLKGKKLYLTINDTLLPNTTYTFNFGTAIADITESNVQNNFKYVFSTGSFLDSLQITGKAVNAYTGTPAAGLLAMLYPAGIEDSILLKQKPQYYAITDDNGAFSIENLALDTFQLFVVRDENINLKYDHGVEEYGFASEPIYSANAMPQTLRFFKQPATTKLLTSEQAGYGKVLLGFTKPEPELTVTLPNPTGAPLQNPTYIEPIENGDSVYFWYNANAFPEDASFLYVNVNTPNYTEDSVRVFLTKRKMPAITLQRKNTKKIKPTGAVELLSNVPIATINTDSVFLYTETDTLNFTLVAANQKQLNLDFERAYNSTQTITFLPGALTDIFEQKNDTLNLNVSAEAEDNLAILILQLSAPDNAQKVLQFFLPKTGEVVFEDTFTNTYSKTLKDLYPTKYGLRIIWDDNKNGKYDVGIFSKRQQPEKVMYYPKPIELRANWELESVWEIPIN